MTQNSWAEWAGALTGAFIAVLALREIFINRRHAIRKMAHELRMNQKRLDESNYTPGYENIPQATTVWLSQVTMFRIKDKPIINLIEAVIYDMDLYNYALADYRQLQQIPDSQTTRSKKFEDIVAPVRENSKQSLDSTIHILDQRLKVFNAKEARKLAQVELERRDKQS